jgi:hypothetical protein
MMGKSFGHDFANSEPSSILLQDCTLSVEEA